MHLTTGKSTSAANEGWGWGIALSLLLLFSSVLNDGLRSDEKDRFVIVILGFRL